jgi:hypothetical protein
MKKFKALAPGIEVNGQTVYSVVDGLGIHKKQAYEILSQNGIDDPQPDEWYSQQAWLDSFYEIALILEPEALFKIGRQIPEDADWPAQIKTIEDALASINVAYHMNHRLKGEILFDPRTGAMKEGIGHYGFELISPRCARMVCLNPYPCEFDQGIIDATAHKFRPAGSGPISIVHDDSQSCRAKDGTSCTYIVKW